jgi:hypothetical protein
VPTDSANSAVCVFWQSQGRRARGRRGVSTLISTFLRLPGDPLYLGADDFDGDNTIGTTDFSEFTSNFLKSVPPPSPN